jgi:hypothetical protein
LNAAATADGITLSWQRDGFNLQGAENVVGPWYDLGVNSQVTVPLRYPWRFYRLKKWCPLPIIALRGLPGCRSIGS